MSRQPLHVANTSESSDPRRLAATFFLNLGWDENSAGGASRLCFADRPSRATAAKTTDVPPVAGCLLLWLPHKVAHGVIPVQRNCWSLTTYFHA
jgi:hypothetical protein